MWAHYTGALENGADLYVNERQKILHFRARSTEERRRMPNGDFFTSRVAYVKLRCFNSFDWKSAIEHDDGVKMRDSVPSARYSSVCNVLHLWRIWLIPTYRVYRLYEYVGMGALISLEELILVATRQMLSISGASLKVCRTVRLKE